MVTPRRQGVHMVGSPVVVPPLVGDDTGSGGLLSRSMLRRGRGHENGEETEGEGTGRYWVVWTVQPGEEPRIEGRGQGHTSFPSLSVRRMDYPSSTTYLFSSGRPDKGEKGVNSVK